MSRTVEESLLKHIEQAAPRYRNVHISWFGGEPLLCLDTVLRVSRKIGKICDRSGVNGRIFLTTNGCSLDPGTAGRLREAGVRYFHITIDGPARHHDGLRPTVRGGPTYEKIMRNLLGVLSKIGDAHITLRMNTDEGNVGSLREVLRDIPSIYRGRIQVNMTPILGATDTPEIGLFRKINQVLRWALENGFQYSDIHVSLKRRTFCFADKENNFHIGPDGTVFKCSPARDKPEVMVGSLIADGSVRLNEAYERWHGCASVDRHCIECPYLCFCGGGCRLERLRGANDLSCRDKYKDIENLIINRYIAIKNGAIGRNAGTARSIQMRTGDSGRVDDLSV
jgi:uncharacterized protein